MGKSRKPNARRVELAAHAAVIPRAWPYPLIEMMLGERPPEDAIAVAAEQPQPTSKPISSRAVASTAR